MSEKRLREREMCQRNTKRLENLLQQKTNPEPGEFILRGAAALALLTEMCTNGEFITQIEAEAAQRFGAEYHSRTDPNHWQRLVARDLYVRWQRRETAGPVELIDVAWYFVPDLRDPANDQFSARKPSILGNVILGAGELLQRGVAGYTGVMAGAASYLGDERLAAEAQQMGREALAYNDWKQTAARWSDVTAHRATELAKEVTHGAIKLGDKSRDWMKRQTATGGWGAAADRVFVRPVRRIREWLGGGGVVNTEIPVDEIPFSVIFSTLLELDAEPTVG